MNSLSKTLITLVSLVFISLFSILFLTSQAYSHGGDIYTTDPELIFLHDLEDSESITLEDIGKTEEELISEGYYEQQEVQEKQEKLEQQQQEVKESNSRFVITFLIIILLIGLIIATMLIIKFIKKK